MVGYNLNELLVSFFRGGGGGGGSAYTGYLYAYYNDTYDATDDGYDAYDTVDIYVDSTPETAILTAKTNGTYRALDYYYDGFYQVDVNVKETEDYYFCEGVDIEDIEDLVELEDGDYIDDVTAGFGLQCVIEDGGHKLGVYQVWSNGYRRALYTNSSDLFFYMGYVRIVNPSDGTFEVTYSFTFDPSRIRTVSRTRSEIIGYGGANHIFAIKRS